MASKTYCNYSIVAALVAAEKVLGSNRFWNTVDGYQDYFLERHFIPCRDEVLNMRMIKSIADVVVEPVNQFLADNGFGELKLDQQGDDGIYAAAILDVLLKWLTPGKETILTGFDKNQYPAFNLVVKDQDGISFNLVNVPDGSGGHANAMHIRIKTKSGDVVNFLVETDPYEFSGSITSYPVRGIEIEGILNFLLDGGATERVPGGLEMINIKPDHYDNLILPMISLEQDVDISYLLGMNTVASSGKPYEIAQALQKNRFKMNHLGVRAQSATAISMRYMFMNVTPKVFTVTTPFFAWLERPGLARPLFVAYLDYDSWKNPGSLDG